MAAGGKRWRQHLRSRMFAACAAAAVLLLGLWLALGGESKCPSTWMVGMLEGDDLFSLRQPRDIKNPVLKPADVTDAKAEFIADTFMIPKDGRWYLFFETFDIESDRGVIAYASSSDAKHWKYERVVLREPFHLSYPMVFEHRGSYYMIPETRKMRGINLYKARAFPEGWEYQKELVHGNYADPSIVHYQDRWWIFAVERAYTRAMFWADELTGPWHKHPESAFFRDKMRSRPGGRPVVWNGKLVRFAQDASAGYGNQVRAFVIDKLTPTEFEEHEADVRPIIKPGGRGWRSRAMHTIDPWRLPDGRWIAVVDGNSCVAGTQ